MDHTCSAPCPLTAIKRHPLSSPAPAPPTGRFGQPITPTCTTLSTINAKQTAYYSPRKNPLVPSIGSSVHIPASTTSQLNLARDTKMYTYVPLLLHHKPLDQSHRAVPPRCVLLQVPKHLDPEESSSLQHWPKGSMHRLRVVRHVLGVNELVLCRGANLPNLLRRRWDRQGRPSQALC